MSAPEKFGLQSNSSTLKCFPHKEVEVSMKESLEFGKLGLALKLLRSRVIIC